MTTDVCRNWKSENSPSSSNCWLCSGLAAVDKKQCSGTAGEISSVFFGTPADVVCSLAHAAWPCSRSRWRSCRRSESSRPPPASEVEWQFWHLSYTWYAHINNHMHNVWPCFLCHMFIQPALTVLLPLTSSLLSPHTLCLTPSVLQWNILVSSHV